MTVSPTQRHLMLPTLSASALQGWPLVDGSAFSPYRSPSVAFAISPASPSTTSLSLPTTPSLDAFRYKEFNEFETLAATYVERLTAVRIAEQRLFHHTARVQRPAPWLLLNNEAAQVRSAPPIQVQALARSTEAIMTTVPSAPRQTDKRVVPSRDPNATDRPFVCLMHNCRSRFPRKHELWRHQRTHTNVRPFRCAHCGRCFSRSDHLATHVRTHTGERPFGCPVCGRRFARSDERRRHLRVHTPRLSGKLANPKTPVAPAHTI